MFKRSSLLSAVLSFAALTTTLSLGAQSAAIASLKPVAQANRIAAHPDFGPQTQLSGHLPAWVSSNTQVARKPVDTTAPLSITIVLQRDATVQAAFEKLLADQQTVGSPLYHQWLTPVQVGQLFGPTDSDLAAVTSWLTAQGLTVDLVSNNHVTVNAHGSTAAVGNAFRTSFASFELNGESRFSAISEPYVPTALAPVIKFIAGLTEVPVLPNSRLQAHKVPMKSTPAGLKPDLTVGTSHFLMPNDFATIYDVNSVYSGGNNGATIGSKTNHVAIIGRARVSATDLSTFASDAGITNPILNTIIPTTGTDPGPACTFANAKTCATAGDEGEQTLDVDRVIGTAPGVNADLVVSLSSKTQDGVYIAAAYNVNTVVDPVMTISYGSCEISNGSSGVSLWNTLFSTGAAEGISTFVSSGDSGANGCASSFTSTTSSNTASINAICSSTYATCVGGTEFADTASPSTYWNTSNGTGLESAISYIPEGGWNEPEAGGTPTASGCNNGTYCPSGSGGGVSLYIAKPTWQTGTGVPTGNFRFVPDVAYPAADHDAYFACLDFEYGTVQGATTAYNCANGYFFGFSGTSAAAPAMAGVAALLNTAAGVAQGNINPLLYQVAAGTSGSTAFHDVTVASSGVSGCVVTTPSMCNNSTPGSSANSTTAAGGVQGYLLTAGYDEVTGLGSIDVAKFLKAAVAPALTATTTTLSVTPNPASAGATVTLKATVASSAATGTVTFYTGTATVPLGTMIGTTASTVTAGVATATTTFSTGGTYLITAVYSGDGTYATSTSAQTSLVVTTPFAVTAASNSLTGNVGVASTDVITVTSTAPFAGAVTLALSNNTAGCTLSSSSVTVTSGGTGTATLTCTPTSTTLPQGVTVTGTNGTTSSAVTISLTAVSASFSLSASPTSLTLPVGATTGNTSTVSVKAVTGFAGVVTLTSSTGCTIAPSSVTLASGGTGTATLTCAPTAVGSTTVTVTGTGAGTGNTATATVTLIGTAPFTLSANPTSLSFTSGATGITSLISVANGTASTANVNLSCNITATNNSNPYYPPTCTLSALSVPGSGTSTLTIGSTTAVTVQQAKTSAGTLAGTSWKLAALMLAMLCLLPFSRRSTLRSLRVLPVLVFLGLGAALVTGCGSGGNSGSGGTTTVTHSSAGTYTVTVTGTLSTNSAVTAQTTVALTIN